MVLPGGGADIVPDEPEQVRPAEPAGGAGYWLVPGRSNAAIVALARILPDGRVATVGAVSTPVADGAEAATGVSAIRVCEMAGAIAQRHGGRLVEGPALVHDGPVGREAWLFVLRRGAAETLRVFVVAGGTYMR